MDTPFRGNCALCSKEQRLEFNVSVCAEGSTIKSLMSPKVFKKVKSVAYMEFVYFLLVKS